MYIRTILGWTFPFLIATGTRADLLDDLGWDEKQFASSLRFSGFPTHANEVRGLTGLPISEEHVKSIAAELSRISNASAAFLEACGDFSMALETKSPGLLDKVRLNVRLGRMDEARSLLSSSGTGADMEFRHYHSLRLACLPLEDAQDWDTLRRFLALLPEGLNSPQWKAAIWSEELDVAWHLDQVQSWLDASASQPVKLAFLHHRLGNVVERDKLLQDVMTKADPARLIELSGLFTSVPMVRSAAFALWNDAGLGNDERLALFQQIIRFRPAEEFDRIFRDWLAGGGDASPLAERIWDAYSSSRVVAASREELLRELQRRHPDDARFQLLLAREMMNREPALAVALFERCADLPVTPARDARPIAWRLGEDLFGGGAPRGDLAYSAFRGLGLMGRQDLVRLAIARQPRWNDLPAADRFRYLAAGGMDYEMVKTATEADPADPANDALAEWLCAALEYRLQEYEMPNATAALIAAKFDVLAAGSSQKANSQVSQDANALIGQLKEKKIDPEMLKQSIGRLFSIITKRDETFSDQLKRSLGSTSARVPHLKDVFPMGDKSAPAPAGVARSKGNLSEWLGIFAPPAIRRLPDPEDGDINPRTRYQLFGWRGGPPPDPVAFLIRWTSPEFELPMRTRLVHMSSVEDRKIGQILMRHFGPENPRCVLAEVMIANGQIDPGDEKLKEQARSGINALLSGAREPRGTEIFRYMALSQRNTGAENLKQVIEDVKKLPMSLREDFVRNLGMAYGSGFAANDRKMRRDLGLESARSPESRPQKPDEDLLKFKDLEKRNLAASPEAVELAKRILAQELDQNSGENGGSDYWRLENALQVTGALDPWLGEQKERLLHSGIPEVEVLRRLRKIDMRRERDGRQRADDYSRRIFELDPTDAAEAVRLFPSCMNDRGLLLKCLRAMGENATYQLSRDEILDAFEKQDAAALFDIIRNARSHGGEACVALHKRLLIWDTKVASELRGWMATWQELPHRAFPQIAEQLIGANMTGEVIDFMASAYVRSQEPRHTDLCFPRKAGVNRRQSSHDLNLERMGEDLGFLQQRKLLAPVISRIDALGGAEEVTMATLRMALTPDAATFEKHALPVLSQLEAHRRTGTMRSWINLFTKRSGSTGLVLRLWEDLASYSEEGGNSGVGRLSQIINEASRIPGSSELINKIWGRISKIPESMVQTIRIEDEYRKCELLRSMLIAADEATWNAYWKWRSGVTTPLGELDYLPFRQAPVTFIHPSRLGEIMPRALEETKRPLPPDGADGWALAAVACGDAALIRKTKDAIEPSCKSARELCDLGLGEIEPVSPVFGVAREAGGDALLWWNLVSIPPANMQNGGHDIPRCPFPALNGKFDLQITSGPSPDRQTILKEIPAATAAGHVSLKLPAGHLYAALLAVEPSSGAVRSAQALEVMPGGGTFSAITDAVMKSQGFERLPWNGPGDLPAWKIRFSGEENVDLVACAWNGMEPVSLSAWACGDGKLELRCLDASGKILKTTELPAWDALVPSWQQLGIRLPQQEAVPAGTVRLALGTSVHGHSDGPAEFALSNVRLEIGPMPELPKGYAKISRVADVPKSVAMAPDSKRLAVVLNSGNVVFLDLNADGGVLDEHIPAIRNEKTARVFFTGNGMLALLTDGSFCRIDLDHSEWVPIPLPRCGGERPDVSSFAVTEDGGWIAWREADRKLLLASLDGKVRRVVSESAAHRPVFTRDALYFLDQNKALQRLAAGDFEKGDPIEEFDENPQDGRGLGETLYRSEFLFRDLMNPKGSAPKPAGLSSLAVPADGIGYFVDMAGNVIRVNIQ